MNSKNYLYDAYLFLNLTNLCRLFNAILVPVLSKDIGMRRTLLATIITLAAHSSTLASSAQAAEVVVRESSWFTNESNGDVVHAVSMAMRDIKSRFALMWRLCLKRPVSSL